MTTIEHAQQIATRHDLRRDRQEDLSRLADDAAQFRDALLGHEFNPQAAETMALNMATTMVDDVFAPVWRGQLARETFNCRCER